MVSSDTLASRRFLMNEPGIAGPGRTSSACAGGRNVAYANVDLTEPCHKVAGLQAAVDVEDARKFRAKDVLVLDISQRGSSSSSSGGCAATATPLPSPLKDCAQLHLCFPSTLLRRPNFQFSQLVHTLDKQTETRLEREVQRCSKFVFYDQTSTMKECSLNTYRIMSKFIPYLMQEKNWNAEFWLLQHAENDQTDRPVPSAMAAVATSDVPSPEEFAKSSSKTPRGSPSTAAVAAAAATAAAAKQRCDRNPNKRKINLKITIPSSGSGQDTNSFVQSFKKDSIHYSPNSLRKYFSFHIPGALKADDALLPRWLRPFTNDADQNLLRILHSFELLEKHEVLRLERCLQMSRSDTSGRLDTASNGSPSRPKKLYSFRQLQREYRPNRHDYDSDNDAYTETKDLKLRMDIHEELNDGENREILAKLKQLRSDLPHEDSEKNAKPIPSTGALKASETEDEDVVETPMDNYLMTRGIQSFTKNRYSNILPYEHSRVKLEPSPVWPENNSNKFDTPLTGSNSPATPLVDVIRKRRNSYFNQDFHAREKNLESSEGKGAEISSNGRLMATPHADSESDGFNDYFNANYLKIPQINVKCNYIATQAPLPSTLDDFWKVVLSNKVKVIISLNSDDELVMRKWDIYWNGKALKKYDVRISKSFDNVAGVKGCIMRVFEVSRPHNRSNDCGDKEDHERDSGEEKDLGNLKKFKANGLKEDSSNFPKHSALDCSTYTVYQLQYTKWLDSCGIVMDDVIRLHRMKNLIVANPVEFVHNLEQGISYDQLVDMERVVKLDNDDNESSPSSRDIQESPTLVHCSAGCGRTGVFITLDILLNILEPPCRRFNRIDVWNMSQDLIFIVVNELRKQRISMVQNLTQYITCYEGILDYFASNINSECIDN
ncbi:LAMI_0H06568g1_1 [Lachancea mirantina]|uniref:LAMI_0H06568g1_1 n=1 Tax=Lachancea mirantina TaxID=1230905 RepID=A0A1G4KFX3_9SACH|nr:LAMI_0H06568g1_1 [Lachancea mirantina]